MCAGNKGIGPPEPGWLRQQRDHSEVLWGEPLVVPEWQENEQDDDDDGNGEYRSKNGWQGRDLIHDVNSPVRITEYYVRYGDGQGLPARVGNVPPEQEEGTAAPSLLSSSSSLSSSMSSSSPSNPDASTRRGGVGTQLTGIVHFTKRAESHRGYCHGGSMCSVLDDVIGWCGFVATGQCLPWSGFTVQINTKLQKPIAVNTVLLVRASVTKIERRKVFIEAKLIEPSIHNSHDDDDDDGEAEEDDQAGEIVHATGDGLVVLNKGVLPEFATMGSFHRWPSSVALT